MPDLFSEVDPILTQVLEYDGDKSILKALHDEYIFWNSRANQNIYYRGKNNSYPPLSWDNILMDAKLVLFANTTVYDNSGNTTWDEKLSKPMYDSVLDNLTYSWVRDVVVKQLKLKANSTSGLVNSFPMADRSNLNIYFKKELPTSKPSASIAHGDWSLNPPKVVSAMTPQQPPIEKHTGPLPMPEGAPKSPKLITPADRLSQAKSLINQYEFMSAPPSYNVPLTPTGTYGTEPATPPSGPIDTVDITAITAALAAIYKANNPGKTLSAAALNGLALSVKGIIDATSDTFDQDEWDALPPWVKDSPTFSPLFSNVRAIIADNADLVKKSKANTRHNIEKAYAAIEQEKTAEFKIQDADEKWAATMNRYFASPQFSLLLSSFTANLTPSEVNSVEARLRDFLVDSIHYDTNFGAIAGDSAETVANKVQQFLVSTDKLPISHIIDQAKVISAYNVDVTVRKHRDELASLIFNSPQVQALINRPETNKYKSNLQIILANKADELATSAIGDTDTETLPTSTLANSFLAPLVSSYPDLLSQASADYLADRTPEQLASERINSIPFKTALANAKKGLTKSAAAALDTNATLAIWSGTDPADIDWASLSTQSKQDALKLELAPSTELESALRPRVAGLPPMVQKLIISNWADQISNGIIPESSLSGPIPTDISDDAWTRFFATSPNFATIQTAARGQNLSMTDFAARIMSTAKTNLDSKDSTVLDRAANISLQLLSGQGFKHITTLEGEYRVLSPTEQVYMNLKAAETKAARRIAEQDALIQAKSTGSIAQVRSLLGQFQNNDIYQQALSWIKAEETSRAGALNLQATEEQSKSSPFTWLKQPSELASPPAGSAAFFGQNMKGSWYDRALAFKEDQLRASRNVGVTPEAQARIDLAAESFNARTLAGMNLTPIPEAESILASILPTMFPSNEELKYAPDIYNKLPDIYAQYKLEANNQELTGMSGVPEPFDRFIKRKGKSYLSTFTTVKANPWISKVI